MRPALALILVVAFASTASADELDRVRVQVDVRSLTGDIGPRPRNTPASARTADWIVNRAAAAGLVIERHPVGAIQVPEVRAMGRLLMRGVVYHVSDDNLVARIDGAEPGPALLVMAHYDTVDGTPGAVDNATGVALLLELGRVLRAGPPPPRPVILAWTAAEESGLAGARALAAELADEVGLAIALDLIGAHDSVELNGLSALFGADWLSWIAEAARAADVDVRAPVPHRVISRHLPQIERSDHGAFTERGVPAFHLYSRGRERVYLHYHMPGDTAERVAWSAVDDAGALLVSLARKPGPLPDRGGSPGMWLTLPGGPRVISSAVLWAIEIVLGLAALSGLVALWRRRRRDGPRRGAGLLGFAVAYAAAWGLAAAALAVAAARADHPAPWVHAPLRAYLAAGAIAVAAGAVVAYLVRRWLPPVGAGRFLAAALVPMVLAGASAMAVGAAELALLPLISAACLGGAAWCERAGSAAPMVALSLLPVPFALDPALLREAVFHGFVPPGTPMWPALAVVLAPYTLAAVYLWRRFGPRGPWRGALVVPVAVAVALVATLALVLPSPTCTGAAFGARSLYCEQYGD